MHGDGFIRDAFLEQVMPRLLCGREMQVRDHTGDPAVDLFRKGLPFPSAPFLECPFYK